MKLSLKLIIVISVALIWVLIIIIVPERQVTYKYLIVHHDSIYDTIETSKYQYLLEENILNAQEGGIFTKVKYIKRIE